jgi:hypothetical protein
MAEAILKIRKTQIAWSTWILAVFLLAVSPDVARAGNSTADAGAPARVIETDWSLPPGASLDSSPSSPPLATDDPGTPGRHGYEVALIMDCDLTTSDRSCEAVINAAFGLGDNAQFRIAKGITQTTTSGSPNLNGVGATDVGIKYRFYDRNGLKIAAFPALRLNDATKQVLQDGETLPTAGTSIYVPVIVSEELGRFTLIANLGRRFQLGNQNPDSTFVSAAIGHATGRTSKVMLEVASESSNIDQRNDARLGFAKSFAPTRWRHYGLNVFASVGNSIGSTSDGKTHRSLLLGVSIARKPN